MGGGRRCALELEGEVVHVAPVPLLTGLEGADQRVGDGPEMAGGMSPRRVVATAHVSAFLTDAQVDPVVAPLGEAVLAAGGGGSDVVDLVEVGAGLRHGSPSVISGRTAAALQCRCSHLIHHLGS